MAPENESAAKPPPLPVIAVASRGRRVVAALMDFLVIGMFAGLLLTRMLWPQEYPDTYSALSGWFFDNMEAAADAREAGEPNPDVTPLPVSEEETAKFVAFGFAVIGVSVWIYFFLSELLMKGASLGKSVFGMRVLSLRSGGAPGALEVSLRATAKSFCFLEPFLLLPVNLLVMLFNRQRRAGHDLLARTIVVAGPPMLAQGKKPDA